MGMSIRMGNEPFLSDFLVSCSRLSVQMDPCLKIVL